jgi:hypothetical protein
MLTNFRVGDRVEDKETHKRGRVTFVYSTLELRDEFIAVLFDGRVETLAVPADSVRKVSTRQSWLPFVWSNRGGCLSRNAGNGCWIQARAACGLN